MKALHEKGIAIHLGSESCEVIRKNDGEVLTGESAGEPLSREIATPKMPTLLCEAEGNTPRCDKAARRGFGAVGDPLHARTVHMRELRYPGNLLRQMGRWSAEPRFATEQRR